MPTGRGLPLHLALQGAGAEVESALVAQQPAGPHVKRLIVDEQPDRALPLGALTTLCPDSGYP